MRLLFLALLSLLCASCASPRKQAPATVDILEIKPRYIEAQAFKRITEYMTGAEHKGRRVILRTDAAQRDGFYFTLVLNQDVRKLPQGTVIEGEFYTPHSKDAQTHTFELPAQRPRTREIFVGLTGANWPEENAVPAAWRFTIKDANGAVLETKQSYLWSL